MTNVAMYSLSRIHLSCTHLYITCLNILKCIVIVLLCANIATATGYFGESESGQQKVILVFGGNGFIGTSTVENLIRANHTVVIVNRGNWYWDSNKTVKPFVKHLQCDRMLTLQKCSDFQNFVWSVDSPAYVDAVIDFSGYHAFEIADVFEILKGKILRYIYISTDSVYEVCNKTHDGFTREEDAKRPESVEVRNDYSARDDYGNRKLQCEEELEKQAEKEGVPYIIFRLPDVVGPRDNTYRWWIYQLWIRLSSYLDKKLSVPRDIWDKPISFVYANDVADVIVDAINYSPDVYNQAYNLANKENPTMVEYLHALMDALDVEDIEILQDDDTRFRLFPSVKLGPVDISKATLVLGWNPTSWIDVTEATASFYEKAITSSEFDWDRRQVVKTMEEYFSDDPMKVHNGLRAVYDIVLGGHHDEL